MKRIAFITSSEDPNLIDDDRLAIPFLEKRGLSVEPLVWDRPNNFSRYDALIFRSCWNYHRKLGEFQSWLEGLRKLQVPILNSLDTVEWNLNKKHILELAVHVPRTEYIKMKTVISKRDLSLILSQISDGPVVLKPAVSLNGNDTFLLNGLDPIHEKLSVLLKSRDMLIQEFIPEIKTSGEVSLVFFNRVFSHAIRKMASENEFRIHAEYGGTRNSVQASHSSLDYSERILKDLPMKLLYARVDLVETPRGPRLIELELTDPMLYLASDPNAAERFADAVATHCLTSTL